MRVKIGKTVLRINVSFAAVITLMLILDSSGLCAVALFCCIVHEMGHIICLFILGEQPKSVELSFYGIRLERSEPSGLKKIEELAVYAAGPLMNVVLSAVLFLFSSIAPATKTAAAISLCIAAFNMLPCVPLDGGNLVLNVFSMIKDDKKAEIIAFYISCITLVPMISAGVIVLFKSGNLTLISVAVYLAVMRYFDKKSM